MTHPLLDEHADLAAAIDILDNWIAHRRSTGHVPGIAVGVTHGGALIWGKGYGLADIESGRPVSLDTRFRIASITKTFTATGILQLRDAGMLGLDDPVAAHLPWFDLRFEEAPAVTIRNLLTHTGGLPRDSVNAMWTECQAPSREDFIQQTKGRKLTRAPYHKFAYSNLGYSLLGAVIAAVSGQSWADYLQTRLLDPLGMGETKPIPSADDPQLATGYTREKAGSRREALPFWLMEGFEASANFASSVRDLAKYAAFHLGLRGAEALSPYSLMDMHRAHWLNADWQGAYGLGLGLHRVNDWEISGHGGGYPGYLTSFAVCREHKTGVIALTNALGSNPHEISLQAFKLVLPELIKATAEEPEAEAGWSRYVGAYESEWDRTQVVVRAGRLELVSLDWLEYPAATLQPTDEPHVFTIEQAGGSNETLRFELDAEGEVVRMWERNEYSWRLR